MIMIRNEYDYGLWVRKLFLASAWINWFIKHKLLPWIRMNWIRHLLNETYSGHNQTKPLAPALLHWTPYVQWPVQLFSSRNINWNTMKGAQCFTFHFSCPKHFGTVLSSKYCWFFFPFEFYSWQQRPAININYQACKTIQYFYIYTEKKKIRPQQFISLNTMLFIELINCNNCVARHKSLRYKMRNIVFRVFSLSFCLFSSFPGRRLNPHAEHWIRFSCVNNE